jgi:plastocyanin
VNTTLFRRRLAPAICGLITVGALANCDPTITDNQGGGGGGGPPVARRVHITEQPTTTDTGKIIIPAVRVVIADTNFLAVTTSTAPVTVTVYGTKVVSLAGTVTRNAVSGTAVMSDLSLDSTGTYRLIASSPGLISDTSEAFVIGLPLQTVDTVELGSTYADTTLQIVFRSARNHSTNPAVDTIRAGSTIHWKWLGTRNHGVLINNGGLLYDSGIFHAAKELTLTIPTAGTYLYICAVHGASMSGAIVVQ